MMCFLFLCFFRLYVVNCVSPNCVPVLPDITARLTLIPFLPHGWCGLKGVFTSRLESRNYNLAPFWSSSLQVWHVLEVPFLLPGRRSIWAVIGVVTIVILSHLNLTLTVNPGKPFLTITWLWFHRDCKYSIWSNPPHQQTSNEQGALHSFPPMI